MSSTEDWCQRCGAANPWSWHVDSDRFNAAMKALDLTSIAIVCPTCFIDGHEMATGMRTVWTLHPDGPFWHIGNIEDERPAGQRTTRFTGDIGTRPLPPRSCPGCGTSEGDKHKVGCPDMQTTDDSNIHT